MKTEIELNTTVLHLCEERARQSRMTLEEYLQLSILAQAIHEEDLIGGN